MAFPSTNTTASTTSNFKKAHAFMNVSVKDKAGNPLKVGGLPLHLDKAVHKALIDLIGTARDGKLELTYEVRLAESDVVVEL